MTGLLEPDQPLLAVIGPSGSGKSTAVRELVRRGVVAVTPSWTTRPRRADESDEAIEHEFVDDARFDELHAAGHFLEVVQPFGLPYRYGLPAIEEPADGVVPAIMLRVAMLPLLARHYGKATIYQVEAEHAAAEARLLARGGELGSRLADFEAERTAGHAQAHRVFVNTGDLEKLVELLTEAVEEDFGGKGTR